MTTSRRQFLVRSGATLGSLAAPAITLAAEGASTRLYVSPLSIYKIARGLVLGIGREAWQYAKNQGIDQVLDLVERLNPRLVEARVATLQHPIDIKLESLEFTVDGEPKLEKIHEYAVELRKITNEDANRIVSENEAREVLALVEKARGEIMTALEAGSTLRLSYNVSYKQAYFRVSNLAKLGHVRLDLTLLRPVRVFNGAAFVADLNGTSDRTQVYTSLWADVCVGRREGPLVRRIAEREISCREAQFLAELEHEVHVLVTNEGESRLSQMIPELIRRIAEGSLQG